MKTHELKTWPHYFQAVKEGIKKFEVRKNDRDFTSGDRLLLMEFNPEVGQFTGREITVEIEYVLQGGKFGVEDGYCVMSIIRVNIGRFEGRR